ncbi:MAG: hypothetical protein JWP29_4871 [Rhodoferax sp.]|nr:hypothetical protein [Rhodoferax sp.]
MADDNDEVFGTTRRPRSRVAAFVIALAGAMLFASFISLGGWQIERRAWKHELVARVDQRVQAAPVAAPGPADWPKVNVADDEYRRVAVSGHFLHDKETLVQAVTKLGSGFWVLTPLQSADGTTVLVNRGFVPAEAGSRASRQASEPRGDVNLSGLLRITEPYGAFLRSNDAAADRWFSRDVAAIATARGLANTAPYFIDAAAVANAPATEPVGGLTVIAFPDNHLVYALTWFALALMVVGGAWRFVRADRQR